MEKACYSFKELKKSAKNIENADKKLAILGNFATQHLAVAVKGYANIEGIKLNVFDADYAQLDAQILDTTSELYTFEPENIMLAMCTEKLYDLYSVLSSAEKENYAESMCEKIVFYWEEIANKCGANIIQFNFAEYDDSLWGNYALKVKGSFLYQIKKLNVLLMEQVSKYKQVFFVDINSIVLRMGIDDFKDDKFYYIAKMPFSQNALVQIAREIVNVIKALNGQVKKCIVLDLDNTLWGGVIGDDGLSGIEIGELGQGHAFTDFQIWLKGMKDRGILLAVCSKNNEDTAKLPFEQHPEMVLKLSDFSMFVANWEDKVSNIRMIQKTLNIGMDSIVFIDDNSFERNAVKNMNVDITVPEMPEDPSEYVKFLKTSRLFETVSYSEEDVKRTAQYQEESVRKAKAEKFDKYEDYLISLHMEAGAKAFDEFNAPRIAQLTQRSNQFNLRTVRYTEEEIRRIAENKEYLTLYFTLKDKVGDYGLISVVIMKKNDNDTIFIDTWLMSCRVLKRSMEEYIINKVVETAAAAGGKRIIGEYLQTPKNSMVKDIYSKMGFEEKENGIFELIVRDYKKNQTYIKEEK